MLSRWAVALPTSTIVHHLHLQLLVFEVKLRLLCFFCHLFRGKMCELMWTHLFFFLAFIVEQRQKFTRFKSNLLFCCCCCIQYVNMKNWKESCSGNLCVAVQYWDRGPVSGRTRRNQLELDHGKKWWSRTSGTGNFPQWRRHILFLFCPISLCCHV